MNFFHTPAGLLRATDQANHRFDPKARRLGFRKRFIVGHKFDSLTNARHRGCHRRRETIRQHKLATSAD